MKNLKVSVFTEGGRNIGFGHVARCLSICQAFEEGGVYPSVYVNGDGNVSAILGSLNYTLVNWINDSDRAFEIAGSSDIVIIDSYIADRWFYEGISRACSVSVYIDDNARIEYPDGIIVNGNIYAGHIKYGSGVRYLLLGTRYTPLRKEFWDAGNRVVCESVKSIMITFGGDDIRNLTPRVLRLISDRFPDLNKEVIIGKGFRNINEIEQNADDKTDLIYSPDARGMRNAMENSEIAISAGGQTLYELARIGVPAVVVGVSDNQKGNIHGWRECGFIEFAGWWHERGIFENIVVCTERLLPRNEREKKAAIGRQKVDGQGSRRIVDFLIDVALRG